MSTIEDSAVATSVREEILRRLASRRWYRMQRNQAHWHDLARENDIALRALVRVYRDARKRVRDRVAAEEEAQLGNHYAFNVEGEPAFNGAFR